MKKAFVPLLAVVAIGLSSPSWAWSKVSGNITSIDPNAHQIALDNGKTYSLQGGVSVASLAVGDKVTVTTQAKAGKNVVSKVTKTS
jgi:hypothetical protein